MLCMCHDMLPYVELGGVFAQAGTAPIITLFIQGTPLTTTPPAEGCMINSKQDGVQNSGPWDPWQASDEKKRYLVYQQGV